MSLSETDKNTIENIRSYFLRKKKQKRIRKKQITVIVTHNIIPLYSPVTNTHREWNPDDISSWKFEIRVERNIKKTFFLNAFYKDIEAILLHIQQ